MQATRTTIYLSFLVGIHASVAPLAEADPYRPAWTHQAIQVHGHRGARARYPENTWPAFEYALEVGVDFLELDLQVTRDDRLVISHDPYINGVHCLGPGGAVVPGIGPLIRTLTLAQVHAYDCGALKNPDFPEQTPVPGTHLITLDELFANIALSHLPAAARVHFNIETKSVPTHPEYTPSPTVFVKLMLDVIRRYGLESRVIHQSFDPRTLIESRRLRPDIPTSFLTDRFFGNKVRLAQAAQADWLSPHYALTFAGSVRAAHLIGMRVVPYTPDTEKQWQRLIDMDVDAIITDDPERLITYLKQRGLR